VNYQLEKPSWRGSKSIRAQTGSSIARLIMGKRGRITMKTEIVIRFGYGATVPWMTTLDDGTLRAVAGPDMMLPPSG
jgi:hypothetical protein